MGDFLKLLQNENMKIYRRLRTWIMMGITVLIPLLIGVLMAVSLGSQEDFGAWDLFAQMLSFYMLVSIFTVIIFSDIVASEFTWGTIKLLLIRPWNRSKILLSKLISGFLFSLLLTLLFVLADLAVSFSLFPTDIKSFDYPAGYTALSYSVDLLLYNYVDLIVIALFAFMLSALFRSSGIAIGLGIFLLFASGIFQLLLDPERFSWAKYVLFTNMDLSRYMDGNGGPAGMTLGFSSAVLAVYAIIFLIVSWVVFTKRDVAA